jgi:hypothetical protein
MEGAKKYSPNHIMPEKSVWIDPMKRTMVVWRIWQGSNPTVELLILTTADAMKWVQRPWEELHELIVTQKMQRCN